MYTARMKQIISFIVLILLIVLVFLFSSSCSTMPEPVQAKYYSMNEINDWIYNNIDYDNIRKSTSTVQSPETTLQMRSGSCYDMCKLFIYLADKSGWHDVRLCAIILPNGNYHMMVYTGTGIYDPTNDKYIGYHLPDGWRSVAKY